MVGAEGEKLRDEQWRDSERRFLGAGFCAPDSLHFPLPEPRAKKLWRLDLDTFAEQGEGGAFFDGGETIAVETATIKVLIECPIAEGAEAPGEARAETVDRL